MSENRDISKNTYTLTLNGRQLEYLSKAAEFYTRVGMAQLHVIRDRLVVDTRTQELPPDVWDVVGRYLDAIRREVFPDYPPNGGPAIRSEKIPEENRVLWDLVQVMRNRIAKDLSSEDGGGMQGVDFNDPLRSSEEPLPEVKNVTKE